MMSLDGYAAGPEQSEENPFGIGGMQLNEWLIPLKAFREMHGEESGEVNASAPIVENWFENVGARPRSSAQERRWGPRAGREHPSGSGTERPRDAMTAIDRGRPASSRTTSSAGPDLHAARSSPARLPLPTGGGTRRLR